MVAYLKEAYGPFQPGYTQITSEGMNFEDQVKIVVNAT